MASWKREEQQAGVEKSKMENSLILQIGEQVEFCLEQPERSPYFCV